MTMNEGDEDDTLDHYQLPAVNLHGGDDNESWTETRHHRAGGGKQGEANKAGRSYGLIGGVVGRPETWKVITV